MGDSTARMSDFPRYSSAAVTPFLNSPTPAAAPPGPAVPDPVRGIATGTLMGILLALAVLIAVLMLVAVRRARRRAIRRREQTLVRNAWAESGRRFTAPSSDELASGGGPP